MIILDAELSDWIGHENGYKAHFIEPDLNNAITAIAFLPADPRAFRKLRLMK